jgi:hypothetical protein
MLRTFSEIELILSASIAALAALERPGGTKRSFKLNPFPQKNIFPPSFGVPGFNNFKPFRARNVAISIMFLET